MQAIETERSPGLPSLMVTTRRRLIPHGTSFSFLQAVTHALHSMQRSASQRNFMRAMVSLLGGLDLAEGNLRFLHARCRVVTVGRDGVRAFAKDDGIRPLGICIAQVGAHEPAAEVEGHPSHPSADAFGHKRLHAGGLAARHLWAPDEDPSAVPDAAVGGVSRINLD